MTAVAVDLTPVVEALIEQPFDRRTLDKVYASVEGHPHAYATALRCAAKRTEDALAAAYWLTEAARVHELVDDLGGAIALLARARDCDPENHRTGELLAACMTRLALRARLDFSFSSAPRQASDVALRRDEEGGGPPPRESGLRPTASERHRDTLPDLFGMDAEESRARLEPLPAVVVPAVAAPAVAAPAEPSPAPREPASVSKPAHAPAPAKKREEAPPSRDSNPAVFELSVAPKPRKSNKLVFKRSSSKRVAPILPPMDPEVPASVVAPSASVVAPSASAVAPSASVVAPSASVVAPSASAVAPSASAVAPSASAVAPSASAVAPSASAVAPSASAEEPALRAIADIAMAARRRSDLGAQAEGGQAAGSRRSSAPPPPVVARASVAPPPPVSVRPVVVAEAPGAPADDVYGDPTTRATERPIGERLVGELFEALHGFHFLDDVREGAAFLGRVLEEKMRPATVLVHVYDINSGHFLVMSASGSRAAALVDYATPEDEPFVLEIMNEEEATLVLQPGDDPRLSRGRWLLVEPRRSVLCAPCAIESRFLGLVELIDPLDGSEFNEDDRNALTYAASAFARFLDRRGIVLSEDEPSVPTTHPPQSSAPNAGL